jgi:hypothetical protein
VRGGLNSPYSIYEIDLQSGKYGEQCKNSTKSMGLHEIDEESHEMIDKACGADVARYWDYGRTKGSPPDEVGRTYE